MGVPLYYETDSFVSFTCFHASIIQRKMFCMRGISYICDIKGQVCEISNVIYWLLFIHGTLDVDRLLYIGAIVRYFFLVIISILPRQLNLFQ
jgi:hypothetical protein